MSKQLCFTNKNMEMIRISPYTDVFVKDTKIILVRNEINQKSMLECSNSDVIIKINQLLTDGFYPAEKQHYSRILEDQTILNWLSSCLKKGLIE